MSQYYDKASLVVVPSGYKAGTVYAQKPLTTDGQLAFTRTGDTATRVNSAGLIVPVLANVPRLDYLGSTCPRLLLEPQRTNLVTYSEQLDNAAWIKEQVSITANATTSPDGTANADKIIANATAGDKYVAQIFTLGIGTAYTISAYFKSSEYTFAYIRFGGLVSNPYVIYNLANQAIVTTTGLTSSSITSVGNGWYRITATVTSTTNTLAPVFMVLPSTGYTLGLDNIPEFTGNGTSGGFLWGCQLEEGAYSTSLIPTLAASATRGADACSKTGISSLIGQTEGTIFAEIYPEEFIDGSYIGISDGTFTNRIIFGFEGGAGNLLVFGNTGLSGAGTYTRGQKIKIAVAYKSGNSALYVNGASVATSAGTFTASYSQFNFNSGTGSQNFYGKCSQALLFKTRLTNAELAELTTL